MVTKRLNTSFYVTTRGLYYKCDGKSTFFAWERIKNMVYDSDRFLITTISGDKRAYKCQDMLGFVNEESYHEFATIITRYTRNFEVSSDFEEKTCSLPKYLLSILDKVSYNKSINIDTQQLALLFKNVHKLEQNSRHKDTQLIDESETIIHNLEKDLNEHDSSFGELPPSFVIPLFLKGFSEKLTDNANTQLLTKEIKSLFTLYRGKLELIKGNAFSARREFISLLDSKYNEIRKIAYEYFKQIEKQNLGFPQFTEKLEYNQRKFLMPFKKIEGCSTPGIETFQLDNLPKEIHFPINHPCAGELYIGHPYNPEVYVPFKNSELIFFKDRVDEYRYLLQCLGATKISISVISGQNITSIIKNTENISGAGGIKLFSADVDYQNSNNSEKNQNNNRKLLTSCVCDPIKAPYCPDGLVWFPRETSWQRLVHERLMGNILEYHETLSSLDTLFTSKSEMNELSVSARFLWAKAGIKRHETFDYSTKATNETVWQIDVTFKSIKDFKEMPAEKKSTNILALTASEKNYSDDVKAIMSDGPIGKDERIYLSLLQKRYGISHQRALEIEKVCVEDSYTPNELEYANTVKMFIQNNQITANGRRIIDRDQKKLGIDARRAKTIEDHLLGK